MPLDIIDPSIDGIFIALPVASLGGTVVAPVVGIFPEFYFGVLLVCFNKVDVGTGGRF